MSAIERSKKSTLLLIVLALSGSGAARADDLDSVAATLIERGLATHQAWELVRSLTVEAGSRFAGSSGDARGVAWAERTMRELGLENVRTEPVTVPHWIRGEAEVAILSPWAHDLVAVALGGSVGTPEAGIEAEVVQVSDLDALEALPDAAVAGKIVFFNRRMERRRDGSDYGPTVQPRGRGPSAAAKRGAVAVVIRSVGTGPHRFAHTGATRYEDGVIKIPAAALAVPDADILEAQLESDRPVRLLLRLTARRLPDAQSANVVGEVVGSERPEEIVLLAAHLDSWDVGTGAHDDGAGVAVVLQAARLVLSLPRRPRRTIRVLLTANEEFGLSGATAYGEAYAEQMGDHVLGVESDLGGGRVWRFATRVNEGALPFMRRVHALLEPLGVEWHGDAAWGGADLKPLREAKAPLADLSADATSYFDYHHTQDDTVDKIDPDDIAQHSTVYAVLAWAVADGDVEPRPAPAVPARR